MNFSSKKEFLKIFLIIWLVAMTSYFVVDIFRKYELKKTQNAYSVGYQDAILGLIKKVKEEKCSTFEIFSGEDRVNIINIECLGQIDR